MIHFVYGQGDHFKVVRIAEGNYAALASDSSADTYSYFTPNLYENQEGITASDVCCGEKYDVSFVGETTPARGASNPVEL